MEKPIMTRDAVIEAAREVHLSGGYAADLQALAGSSEAWHCHYRAAKTAPMHCDVTVCIIGAFLLKHGLLSRVVWDDKEDCSRELGDIVARVSDIPRLGDLVEIPDMRAVQDLQNLHDSAVYNDRDRAELRGLLGLEPA